MSRFEGDLELLHEASELFRHSCPKLLSQLRESIHRGDGFAIARTAHTIKGSAANFGSAACMEAALKLEKMGEEQDLRNAEAAFQALESEIERLIPALSQLT